MATYLSPGVYVEEIDTGPQPIEGVSTSITGAVGVTAFGPTSGKPVLVTSFAEFEQNFGGFLPTPPATVYNKWALDPVEGGEWWQFPLAVKGYFDNGGQQLFVKRVFSKSSVAASANLGQGLLAAVAADAASGATSVQLSHLVDVFEGAQLQFFRGDTNAAIGGPSAVSAYDGTSRRVTLGAALPAPLVTSRGDYAAIHAYAPATTLTFSAKALGVWGNDLSVQVSPMVGATMSLAADPTLANNGPASASVVNSVNNAGPPATTTVTVDVIAGFQNNDHVLIAGVEYAISNIAGNAFNITPALAVGQSFNPGTPVKRLRLAVVGGAGTTTINVWTAPSLYTKAIVQLDTGHLKEGFTVVSITGNKVTLSQAIANTYYEGYRLCVIEAAVSLSYDPDGGLPASEIFTNLRLVNDGSASYLVNFVNQQSKLATVRAVALSWNDLTKFPTTLSGGARGLTAGDDGLTGLTIDDFVGVDGGSGARTGIQAMEDITQIGLCVVPGIWSRTVQSALITHCESLRYRFAILDTPSGLGIEDVLAFRAPFDTKFAALYYPWIDVRDPSVSLNVSVAPSGHIAGIYARVDNDRGYFKAPANEELLSIFDISQDVNKREQDLLNPVGVNALRFFPNRGYRVWGARTLSSESAWKYVNVKRIFIYVEASIDYGTQWVVFESNDEPLWARVRQTITDFLTTTWRSGALQGTKPSEAFFVKCDRTTMTQDDIDNGRLICVIGIAPVKPAEFVIFRIQQFIQTATASS